MTGTFVDVTKKTGTDDPRWSTSAAFSDYDRDGWLDLMLVNYANFSVANSPTCYAPAEVVITNKISAIRFRRNQIHPRVSTSSLFVVPPQGFEPRTNRL